MNTRNLVILVLGGLAALCVAAAVGLLIAVPDGANTGSIAVILLGFVSLILPVIGAVVGVAAVDRKVDHLSNGLMDHKIVRGVHVALDQRDPSKPNPPTEEPRT